VNGEADALGSGRVTQTVLIAGGGTGGHLMPALAIATRLRERCPELEPVLVGAERGIEAQLLPRRDFRYHLLPVEPVYRRQWWKNFRWPFIAWRLLARLGDLFEAEHPVAVVGTGGYASGPAVWLAGRRRIPSAIQEQNAYPGLVTRLLARRVQHIYLGLPEARARLRFDRATRVFDTGNPITPPDPGRREEALRRFGLADRPTGGPADEGPVRPVLLVTGGSQGALAVNRVVAAWLESGGAEGVTVIWATGRGSYHEFAHLNSPPMVQLFDFLDPIADAYAVADLVVARAGMMSGAELCAWGLPSVLIPLPTAAEDHQRHNAEALAAAGAAEVLLQRDLSPDSFGRVVGGLLADAGRRRRMADAARARGKPAAADEIVSHLLTLLGGSTAFATSGTILD
jgi:UDP-N-acetylglucosamine--N-acetylmuramyl-(pentapeptide) pyrophosphoryl-undecaprenol N-acetylglucosamine transferase